MMGRISVVVAFVMTTFLISPSASRYTAMTRPKGQHVGGVFSDNAITISPTCTFLLVVFLLALIWRLMRCFSFQRCQNDYTNFCCRPHKVMRLSATAVNASSVSGGCNSGRSIRKWLGVRALRSVASSKICTIGRKYRQAS